MPSKLTSKRPRRNPDRRVAALAAELHALALDAAEDRQAGRSDRWFDKEIDRISLGLLDAGLTPRQAADVVVSAYSVGSQHQRRRMARNRKDSRR